MPMSLKQLYEFPEARIILLEPDGLQAGSIIERIKRITPGTHVTTEYAFRTAIDGLAHRGATSWPDLFVLEMLVPWVHPEETVPQPEDVERQGFYFAGYRCFDHVRKVERRMGISPRLVIFYSVLDEID